MKLLDPPNHSLDNDASTCYNLSVCDLMLPHLWLPRFAKARDVHADTWWEVMQYEALIHHYRIPGLKLF